MVSLVVGIIMKLYISEVTTQVAISMFPTWTLMIHVYHVVSQVCQN